LAQVKSLVGVLVGALVGTYLEVRAFQG